MKFIFTLFSKIFGAKTEEAPKLRCIYEPTPYESDSEILSLLKSIYSVTTPILDLENEVVRIGDELYIEIDDKAEVMRIKHKDKTLALRKKSGGRWYVHRLILLKLKLEQA